MAVGNAVRGVALCMVMWTWACGDAGPDATQDGAAVPDADAGQAPQGDAGDGDAGDGDADAGRDAGDADAAWQDAAVADGSTPDAADADAGGPLALDRLLPAYRSGTRLQARMVGPAGGAGTLLGFYDSVLATPCQFDYAEDGALRCLPVTFGVSGHISATCDDTPLTLHSNAQCGIDKFQLESVPLTPVRCGDPSFGSAVYDLTPVALPDPYYDGSPESCSSARSPAPEWTASERDSHRPASDFVAATTDREGGEDGLGVVVINAEDGAREVRWLFDQEGVACQPQLLARGADHCVPRSTLYGASLFTDAACGERALVVSTTEGLCPRPDVVQWYGPAGPTPEIVGLGDPIAPTEYFRLSGDTCAATTMTVGPDAAVHRVASEPAPLPRFGRVLVGEGTLRTAFRTNAGGTLLMPGALIEARPGRADAAYFALADDTLCVPFDVAGTFRCLPPTAVPANAAEYFADAACAEPVRVRTPNQGEVPGGPSLFYVFDYESCGQLGKLSVSTTMPVLDAYTGMLYTNNSGSCQLDGPAPDGAYRVDAPNPEDLPALETWVDPG